MIARGVIALLGVACLTLVAIGPPSSRTAPTPRPRPRSAPAPSRVSVGGFTLTSTAVDLPTDTQVYPDGPGVGLVNARCTACHSPAMALTQPRLSREKWREIVRKMQATYRAPMSDDDVPVIADYLFAIQE